MKRSQQFLKRQAGIIGVLCLLAATFSSCMKNKNNEPQTPFGLVSVIHTSPDAPSQDFYLDNNRANNVGITYGHGLDYIQAYTGKRTVAFYNNGTQQKTISDTLTVKDGKYYSVYLANVVSHPDILILKDTIAQPAAGMVTIRLVNVSPDAGAVDLAIKGGAVLATNKPYKGFSSFVPLQGNTKYTLEIRQAGTTTVLASITDVTLPAAAIYTVWLQGLKAATDQTKLTAGLQQNVYYY
jgi:hypothetical protein